MLIYKGTVYNIKQVNIIWEDAGASEYYIEVSTDGENCGSRGMGRQQNRNDAIILFIMSNARYVRIVGTARNTNQRSTSPAVTTDPVTAESAETTTPVATKSDMITNQAAMEPVSTSEQTTAKSSIKVAKTKVKKAAKDKNSKSAKISLKKIEVLWFMA